jgi:hypothetical protein
VRAELPCLALVIAALLLWIGNFTGSGGHQVLGLALIAVAIPLGIAALARISATQYNCQPAAPPRARRICWLLAALLLLHAGIAHHLASSTSSHIDSCTFQQSAVENLLRGIDPYGRTNANLYSASETRRYYGPGVVVNGRVQVGLQYPPLSFLSALPGYLLGDLRYGYILTILLAAVFLFAMAPDAGGLALAAFLLFDPITLIVEDACWTEALVLMLLCATLYAASRNSRWMPLALGLFLASKQYNFLALPFLGFLLPVFSWKAYAKLLGTSLAVAATTLLPFALWNAPALWHDLVLFHLAQPYRQDALSFSVLFPPYLGIGLLVLLLFAIWMAMCAFPSPPAFAAAYAMALLLFISCSKQAFANYYFLVVQSLLLAAMLLWPRARTPDPTRSRQQPLPPGLVSAKKCG